MVSELRLLTCGICSREQSVDVQLVTVASNLGNSQNLTQSLTGFGYHAELIAENTIPEFTFTIPNDKIISSISGHVAGVFDMKVEFINLDSEVVFSKTVSCKQDFKEKNYLKCTNTI